ncbi:MAG: helix-turn-helix domain-containing protein [Anaerolineales bacterium]
MQDREAAGAEVEKVSAALRQRIRLAGLTLREVEERLGMGKNYLRQLLSGAVDLKLKHLLAVLQVVGESPVDFFVGVYGVPRLERSEAESDDPYFRAAIRAMQRSTLRVVIWKLREKGVFTNEEAAQMLAQLDLELPPIPI